MHFDVVYQAKLYCVNTIPSTLGIFLILFVFWFLRSSLQYPLQILEDLGDFRLYFYRVCVCVHEREQAAVYREMMYTCHRGRTWQGDPPCWLRA